MTDERVFHYVLCPKCEAKCAWLGDQASAVSLFGECFSCKAPTITDDEVARVIAEREERERVTGRRVFPCPNCGGAGCSTCQNFGWIIGYPPKNKA
jgi:hypothetical protein